MGLIGSVSFYDDVSLEGRRVLILYVDRDSFWWIGGTGWRSFFGFVSCVQGGFLIARADC